MKQFNVTTTDDDTNNVFGGPIGDGNVYIRAYPKPIGKNKHPLKLELGESSLCSYSLSGSTKVYRVTRIA